MRPKEEKGKPQNYSRQWRLVHFLFLAAARAPLDSDSHEKDRHTDVWLMGRRKIIFEGEAVLAWVQICSINLTISSIS